MMWESHVWPFFFCHIKKEIEVDVGVGVQKGTKLDGRLGVNYILPVSTV